MLRLLGMSRKYGSVQALDNLSFEVSRGEVVGFLGPNGAGKTTAMRAVLGIVELDSGTMSWDGQPIDLQTRRRFGYMPEERGLYPSMRVEDQLLYLGQLHGIDHAKAKQSVEYWLNEVGLFAARREQLSSLSLGNQQRVQLVAALLHQPELLILDEPFSGLDPPGIEALTQTLRNQASQGAAVVFSSHQLDLVENVCDRVVIVNKGEKVREGTLSDLTQSAQIMTVRLNDSAGNVTTNWTPTLPGTTVLGIDHGNVRIETAPDITLDALLNDASRAGRVVRIGYESKRLSEVFREAVR